jgi:hypothetical protein
MKTAAFITLLLISVSLAQFDSKAYSDFTDLGSEESMLAYEPGNSTRAQCEFAYYPGFSQVSICSQIYDKENSWWLPDAYIYNAQCACSTLPTNSNTANCIRQYLVERLRDQTRYNATFRNEMAEWKKKYNKDKILHWPGYKEFLIKKFTPLIYEDHDNAYYDCCCKGRPAFYASWEAVVTIKMPTCLSVRDAIDVFGSCSNHPGRW